MEIKYSVNDSEIVNQKKVFGNIKEELDNKVKEIEEKIINLIKHNYKSYDNEDDNYSISDVSKAGSENPPFICQCD